MESKEKENGKRAGRGKNNVKYALARPVSLSLTLLCILGILALVIGVVVPQLGSTFESIGQAMKIFLPKAQVWLEELFAGEGAIADYIASINLEDLNWEAWLGTIKDFAVNGAGSVLSYTMSATMAVVNSVVTFFVAFIFAIYVLMQKEKLGRQFSRLLQAVFREKAVEKALHICSLSHATFSKFITGQCVEALILGGMFFVVMGIFRFPYALLVGILIAFTALIPIVGAFIGCFIGAFLILSL